ncbi:diguanylate cyclase [Candidatus Fermentibacterales bacterium]|nr:diguanylate cyclase [Candidatus Fermentibacterales bacterium]
MSGTGPKGGSGRAAGPGRRTGIGLESEEALRARVAKLEEEVARLDLIFRNAVDIILMIDATTGRILRASDAVTDRLGYEPGELAGTCFADLIPDSGRDCARTADSLSGLVLDGVFLEQSLVTAGGELRDFDMTVSLVDNGSCSLILATLRDTRERKTYERELQVRKSALDSSLSATAIVAPDWTVSYANDALLRTWMLDDRGRGDGMAGIPLERLWKQDERSGALLESMRSAGSWTGEITCVRCDGQEFPALTMANSVRSDSGDAICMVFSFVDITERRRLEEELTALSLIDSLTGLYNRRGLLAMGDELMKSARRNSEKAGMLFVDLDCLKLVNDRYGHDEGDEVLRTVAALIRGAIREKDLACRIGGDEFAVLISKKRDVPPDAIVSRLVEAVRGHNSGSGRPYRISVSIGYTEDEPSGTEAIRVMLLRSDRAMYETKRAKKRSTSDEELLSEGGATWLECPAADQDPARAPAQTRQEAPPGPGGAS